MNKNTKELKSEIKDALTCFICLEKVKNPHMCLNCRKICCEECLKMWFESNYKCPLCKVETSLKDMPKLDFIDQFSDYFLDKVEKIPDSQKQNINEEKEEEINNNKNNDFSYNNDFDDSKNDDNFSLGKSQMLFQNMRIDNKEEDVGVNGGVNNFRNLHRICKKHGEPIEYICLDCESKHCSKCLLIFTDESKNHLNHLVITTEQDKKFKIQKTLSEIKNISNIKGNLENYSDNINSELKVYKNEEDSIVEMIEEFKNIFKEKIEIKKKELQEKSQKIQKRIDDIDKAVNYSEDAIKNFVNNKDEKGIKDYAKKIDSLRKFDELKHPNKFINNIHPKFELYQSKFLEIKINLEDEKLGELDFNIDGLENDLKLKIMNGGVDEALVNLMIQLNDIPNEDTKIYPFYANLIAKRSYEYICSLKLDEKMIHGGILVLGKTLIKNSLLEYINRHLHKFTFKVIICKIEI